MKNLFVLFITLCFISFAATLVVAQSSGPAEYKYPSAIGTVTFNHASHENLVDCASCHSVVLGIDQKARKDAFHDLCISCHKEQKQGPTSCRDCHVR